MRIRNEKENSNNNNRNNNMDIINISICTTKTRRVKRNSFFLSKMKYSKKQTHK